MVDPDLEELHLVLEHAAALARRAHHPQITLEHLLRALLDEPDAIRAVQGCGGDPVFLQRELDAHLEQHRPSIPSAAPPGSPPVEIIYAPEIEALLGRALGHAQAAEMRFFEPRHILAELMRTPGSFASGLLSSHGLRRLDLLAYLAHGTLRPDPRHDLAPGELALLPRAAHPGAHRVVMHNDDFTTREFVVEVLEQVFELSRPAAEQLMLRVHRQGEAVVGTFEGPEAEDRAHRVMELARAREFPLQITLEPVSGRPGR